MAQSTDLASEEVVAVNFGLMTSEEVKKLSVVNVHNPTLMASDTRPMPGGLYDPLMGPLNEGSVCKSCGQRYQSCPGHCGHINLVAPAYNPLLFNMLYTILNNTCLFCLHFRASNVEVNKCVNQLKLIAKGDIVGAEKLEGSSLEDLSSPDDSDGSHVSYSTLHSIPEDDLEHNVAPFWDSLRFTEAMAILKNFMGKKRDSCKRENCGAKNPSITKPTFGWFNMAGLTDSKATHNAMMGVRLFGGYCRRTVEKSSSEVINTDEDTDRAINLETEELVEAAPQEINMRKTRPILPFEVRDVLQQLWENETPLCSLICNIQQNQVSRSDKTAGYFMFFLDTVLVPPIRFRPEAKGGDSTMAHAHTTLLGKVIECNIAVRNARINKVEGSKIVNRWMELQQSINLLYYGKTGKGQRDAAAGICQLLEKKEGIFRQKMMGKRVNYACRSVISPDPYLAVNEIGVPPYFALRLSYPERVTPWNVAKLREAVINGPESHPGALKYSDKGFGLKRLPVERKARIAISRKLPSSSGVATQSGKNSGFEFEGKIVYRHLQDGDIVLVNRQPTLHKPSIMAHVVRVLKGEKTLRMHYANCSTYNADFDGDEMNVHFPQDEISRAEAYNIVNANEQYIVPTKGDTTGLHSAGLGSVVGRPSRKVSLVELEGLMQPILPAVWKPVPLWTGKQVISALLNHLTRGQAPCTVEGRAKIPYPYFPSGTGIYQLSDEEDKNAENKFLVYKNELVHGVIDKAQFGKFGLVHTVQELYGSNAAGILLSSLSRLFTIFLQMHGFTCGVDDLIILPHYDIQRKEELEGEDGGEEVHCEFVKYRPGQIGPKELQMEIEKAICSDRDSATASLDMKMKNKLSKKGSQISKELLTKGLLKPFPWNCISLMTISGAKGSTVNFQQISSYLGQQELEGKRVPRMVSGKSLPCFPPWDFTSRAGGYITDRFLSGLRPQEYYFHCMAGREGLVDTAVKTSRSGYLQRCLVKNLESLKVCYDYTVRDSDGSIVQFYYGEDGVDVHRTSFLKNFKALADNPRRLCQNMSTKHWVYLYPAVAVLIDSSIFRLNTFHLAGRGEMNVTLGIPRLQEILMTAGDNIKTPILTCPFKQWRPKSGREYGSATPSL
ncbi:hypothetical protein Leryth_001057 [Lithospermum erythrorhizon]|nr:hypothetical protein Leryth_001057 [Lithospermum erythrorhizon]